MKTCVDCGEEKSVEDFYANPNTGDGLLSWCKLCHRRKVALRQRTARYGITPEQYQAMLDAQGGVCAICGKPETTAQNGVVKELGVDHDHRCCPHQGSCGRCIRGLLCARCNAGTGNFGDTAEAVGKAYAYLLRYESAATVAA